MSTETSPVEIAPSAKDGFVDRRGGEPGEFAPGTERRQFVNSHGDLSPPARELASAVDEYKLMHRRRFVTYEELLQIVMDLGYAKA